MSTRNIYWADNYVKNKIEVKDAIKLIKPGQRVFIGSSCGEPQYLVKELAEMSNHFTDIEIIRLMSLESAPLTFIANKSKTQIFNIRSFYLGSARSKRFENNKRFITPINLSAVPRLFKSRMLPIHVALIQVSPPDDFGWMSLGVSVDVTLAAAQSADIVIAQVNSEMPRVLGRSFIHVNDVDVVVEYDEPILTIQEHDEVETANMIARHSAKLIEDGSTIQNSLGETPEAITLGLASKNDLGIHTQYLTDGIMRLFSEGVVTNKYKGYNNGKIIASTGIGSRHLYDFLDDNPLIEFHPSNYVNNPAIIAKHNKMVSFNIAMAVDLTGQVAADALAYNNYSGVTGMLDFIRGTAMSKGGKSIIVLTSTTKDETISRIVPTLSDIATVVPRGDVQYVVTEYGTVNLFGKNLQERAIAMISIAHPKFRDELFQTAKDLKLIGTERSLSDSLQGVYPLKIEEMYDIDGINVFLRPAKTVDARKIQEHYYNLDKIDIISRFFHEKTSFVHRDVERTFEIDYVKDLTIIALVGEIGFGEVIGVGEYLLDEARNMAEVAFSVSKKWQGKGVARKMINKLADAAKENGIFGLFANTSPQNQRMIKLFHSLPYKIHTSFDDDFIQLICKFDQIK